VEKKPHIPEEIKKKFKGSVENLEKMLMICTKEE